MIRLSQLKSCFQGIVPASIATCSRDGIPNASYISHVHYVDAEHVAISFQFFNKTRKNILENPFAEVKLLDPGTLRYYTLKLRYIRSEFDGPVFDEMEQRLHIIAAHESMTSVFRLRAADIYLVEDIDLHDADLPAALPEHCDPDLELLRVAGDRIASTMTFEEAIDTSLACLQQVFGFRNILILQADPEAKVLTTIGSAGYQQSGIGSEIPYGTGLAGLVAVAGRKLHATGIRTGVRYLQTSLGGPISPDGQEIPLPVIGYPDCQVAIPLQRCGELFGVLAVESDSQRGFSLREQNILSSVANHLAAQMCIFLRDTQLPELTLPPDQAPVRGDRTQPVLKARYIQGDDAVFVNDEYVIKNVPARILWYLMQAFSQGREEFSNRELRAEKWLQLPGLKDNLESRLILLRKRLAEKVPDFQLVQTGRGRFRVCCQAFLQLEKS